MEIKCIIIKWAHSMIVSLHCYSGGGLNGVIGWNVTEKIFLSLCLVYTKEFYIQADARHIPDCIDLILA